MIIPGRDRKLSAILFKKDRVYNRLELTATLLSCATTPSVSIRDC